VIAAAQQALEHSAAREDEGTETTVA
jgi:hypothetical protein